MEKKEVINKITNHSSDLMDKHFPKGECMERGKALVFNAEMIVYVSDLLEQELDKAREEVERKFVEKYHKRGKEMNVPYSEEDGKEFWQGYKEGYNQGLKDMIVDTYYLDKEFELKLKQ